MSLLESREQLYIKAINSNNVDGDSCTDADQATVGGNWRSVLIWPQLLPAGCQNDALSKTFPINLAYDMINRLWPLEFQPALGYLGRGNWGPICRKCKTVKHSLKTLLSGLYAFRMISFLFYSASFSLFSWKYVASWHYRLHLYMPVWHCQFP